MVQNDTKQMAQNYTEVGIAEPERVKNIQLQDNISISISDTIEWQSHVNTTNRTDLLKDNYSEKVINDVVNRYDTWRKNSSVSLAQVGSNRSLSQNYTEERIEHEDELGRDDPSKQNHTDAAAQEEDDDKEVEVHEPNLTVSLTQKQMEMMKNATVPEHEDKLQIKKDIIILAPKDKNSSVPANTTSVASKKVPKPILDLATNNSEKLPVNNLTWIPDKEEVPTMSMKDQPSLAKIKVPEKEIG